MQRLRKVGLGLVAAVVGSIVLCLGVVGPCWSAWLFDGVLLRRCPVGDVRPTGEVHVRGVGRGSVGVIAVSASGYYVDRTTGEVQTTPIRRVGARLELTDPTGKMTVLDPEDDDPYGFTTEYEVELPAGPDGDWKLEAIVDTPAGESPVKVTVPLYAPALGHLLLDAPLYKPGQTLRFRSVTLHEGDLSPLTGRPGTWTVTGPDGTVLLEERGVTAGFGVASSTFPLADDAESGLYTVTWSSGSLNVSSTVEVRTFQLPRFQIEARAERRWFGAGDEVVVNGTVRYSSGAPVVGATVTTDVRASGPWPPPNAWLDTRTLASDRSGAFVLRLGAVPSDLVGQGTLQVALKAVDATGDTVYGAASVLLSQDRIVADAVTELADGLVPAINNRVYLRVARPDGEPLRGATVSIIPTGAADERPIVATADADGVVKVQLDPGEPVTVVEPPQPVRVDPRRSNPHLSVRQADTLLDGRALDVEGRGAVARWAERAQGCLVLGDPGGATEVALLARIGRDGRVTHVQTSGGNPELAACVADVARATPVAAGEERVWNVQFDAPEANRPWLQPDLRTWVDANGQTGDADFAAALAPALRRARPCLAGVEDELDLPRFWLLQADPGSTRVRVVPTDDPDARAPLPSNVVACVGARMAELTLPAPPNGPASATARLLVRLPSDWRPPVPQPTTWPGYELRVAARVGEETVGNTILRMRPGTVPPLRLRFSEVLVDAGAEVELTAIRGADFAGELPKELLLTQGGEKVLEFALTDRKGRFTLPADARGYYRVEHAGAAATLYVRDPRRLDVALSANAERWKPGQEVQLTVTTRGPDGPTPAGVTLSGVDASFAALAPLPDPATLADVTVRATSDAPAFGVLDARALQTGQIRGDNAAQAAVLRVSGLPPRPPGQDRVDASGAATFDWNGQLTDAFYTLYGQARSEVRAWERKAPAGEPLTAAGMVSLWEKTLSAHPAEDPFGRRLHLSALPPDLLALTDPRFMVADGARLPEDVENWAAHVAEEAP